jgi:hypothetical protein
MSGFRYSHPRDQLLRTATSVTVSLANALTDYGAENLSIGDPAHPFKADAGTVRVVWGWASPVFPKLIALLNSNLDVAARWQGHTSSDFDGSPGPDIDVAFGVPAYNAQTGFFTSPWLNMSAYEAKPFWSLLVTANTLDAIVGELWAGSDIRDVAHHLLLDGASLNLDSNAVIHQTGYGVDLSYEQTTERESMTGQLYLETPAEHAAVRAWVQAARRNARPCVVVPDVDVDDAWHVKLTEAVFAVKPTVPGASAQAPEQAEVMLGFRMTSRGMPWVDPDAD